MPLCKCGCKQPLPPGNNGFLPGHQVKRKTKANTKAAEPPTSHLSGGVEPSVLSQNPLFKQPIHTTTTTPPDNSITIKKPFERNVLIICAILLIAIITFLSFEYMKV